MGTSWTSQRTHANGVSTDGGSGAQPFDDLFPDPRGAARQTVNTAQAPAGRENARTGGDTLA